MKRSSYSLNDTTQEVQHLKLHLIRAGIAIFLLAFISLFIYMNMGAGESNLAGPGKSGALPDGNHHERSLD